jgi:hypothetical protein
LLARRSRGIQPHNGTSWLFMVSRAWRSSGRWWNGGTDVARAPDFFNALAPQTEWLPVHAIL